MSHNDELIDELRLRREALTGAIATMEGAKVEHKRCQEVVAGIRGAIDEILLEIVTGTSGRPLLDAVRAAGNGDAPRSGLDLVTSRPGSGPEANGVDVPGRPSPNERRNTKKGKKT